MTIDRLLKILKKVPPKQRKAKIAIYGDIFENGKGGIVFNGKIYQVN